jgi:hypothetical protein
MGRISNREARSRARKAELIARKADMERKLLDATLKHREYAQIQSALNTIDSNLEKYEDEDDRKADADASNHGGKRRYFLMPNVLPHVGRDPDFYPPRVTFVEIDGDSPMAKNEDQCRWLTDAEVKAHRAAQEAGRQRAIAAWKPVTTADNLRRIAEEQGTTEVELLTNEAG